jgi:hypothetical protein
MRQIIEGPAVGALVRGGEGGASMYGGEGGALVDGGTVEQPGKGDGVFDPKKTQRLGLMSLAMATAETLMGGEGGLARGTDEEKILGNLAVEIYEEPLAA